ncbi:MAG TPA: MBL fold metallo-hydrolase [Polyangiaceae bacterium]|nr:MBL fold metallo-hydrolase [Polyangiaceae bacterium]
MDKSVLASTPPGAPGRFLTATPRLARRQWLQIALAASGGVLSGEIASLAGAWDHRRATLASPPGVKGPVALGGPRLFHVGHCCHLIELGGQRWLTDPWFFNPAFGSLTHTSGIGVDAIGPLDGIFISHRHPDHFDPSALRRLDRQARVWTPDPSLIEPLRELGFQRVSLSVPWQSEVVGALTVSFVPAVHDVPQHSLMLVGPDARVLFCGDTGAHDHWGEVRRRYRPSTALLPCDGTALRWEPRQIMNPEEAARAALELGCRQVLQTHADATYTDPIARYLLSSSEPEPLERLSRALERAGELAAPASESAAPALAPAVPSFSPLAIGETRALVPANSDTI